MSPISRIDKVSRSTHRAPLNFEVTSAMVGDVIGVGINTSGRVVAGAGAAAIGVCGVICPTEPMAVGAMIDVCQDGTEIADFDTLADGSTAATNGTQYYASTSTGAVSTTNTGAPVGYTVETNGSRRLIVRIERPAA